MEKVKANLNQRILFFTEESTPWFKMGIMASTLLPSCPIPEIGEEKISKFSNTRNLEPKTDLNQGNKFFMKEDKIVLEISFPQIQESVESRHL